MEQKQSLLVHRDGQIDQDYYDAVWAEKRQEALRTAGREALHVALRTPLIIAKGLGWLMTHDLPKQPVQ